MKVAVTGAGGFIGAHTTRALVDAGHEVRVLLHPSERLDDALAGVGVAVPPGQVVVGDLREPGVAAELLTGCDAVLHAAGVVGVDDRREQEMWEVNVQATAEVLGLAVGLGLDPIVHVSSYSALFPSPEPVITGEVPTTGARSAYGRTKSAGDRLARGLQAAGAPVVVTYPGTVVGPPAGSMRGVSAGGWEPMIRHGVSVSFPGGMTLIDVRDVAALHAAVMEPGRGPRRYVCGGDLVAFDTMVDIIEEAVGRHIRRLPLGRRGMLATGRLVDAAAAVLPVSPALSHEAAWLLTSATPTDDTPAKELLGRPWRTPREALRAALGATDPEPDPPSATPAPQPVMETPSA